MLSPLEVTFSSAAAQDLSGASGRQLHYWCQAGWLEPIVARDGGRWRRRWPPDELRVLALLADLQGPRRGGAHGTLPRAARAVRRAPLARYLLIEQSDGEMYTIEHDAALIGALCDVDGWLAVTRIRTISELTEGTPP